jgi:hypothetical protein
MQGGVILTFDQMPFLSPSGTKSVFISRSLQTVGNVPTAVMTELQGSVSFAVIVDMVTLKEDVKFAMTVDIKISSQNVRYVVTVAMGSSRINVKIVIHANTRDSETTAVNVNF